MHNMPTNTTDFIEIKLKDLGLEVSGQRIQFVFMRQSETAAH